MKVFIQKDASTVKFNKHWQFCVGSPHAVYALRRDWTQQLKVVYDELGIKRVRFHGIFCDDMHTYHKLSDLFPVPGGNRIKEKSFRWCAAAYDNVLSTGMRPFVELSFMPRHLARKNKKGMFFYKPNISPPADLREWGSFVEAFVRFLVDRYGIDEVEKWYFEVWNEPDLRLPFFAGTKEDYFKLYKETVTAVKKVNSRIRVGGPSTSGSKWVKEFLLFCKENELPVDFVSTHQYAGDPLGGIDDAEKAKININPFVAIGKNRPDTVLEAFRKLMMTDKVMGTLKKDNLIRSSENAKIAVGDVPLFYTEWNLCASFSAPCNDTAMVAAYDVHSILGTGATIDGSSLWCFTDLFEELHPFPEEFHGGFGMMTQSGIKKPLFYALKLLGQLPEDRIELPCTKDRVTVAAFRGEDSLHIVAALFSEDCRAEKEKISICVECEKSPEEVSIIKIDDKHCNPYAEWVKEGSPQVPTPGQVKHINEASDIVKEALEFSFADGRISIEADISENSVCFIEIKF